ncbi:hypothetical protein AWB69_06331 [Caballeronia udeis]|uniref:Uncharacterized protein n=1 Tax=Caballeronia udeis TaxID=1232866 RepID=A0A168GWY1_9BURK|nr:hypothetical protein AWB69_06331 [Caballeronia udeis]
MKNPRNRYAIAGVLRFCTQGNNVHDVKTHSMRYCSDYCVLTRISTRRFFARPATVEFDATGFDAP